MKTDYRSRIRAKQNKLIALASAQSIPVDTKISEVQAGSPTLAQLRDCIFPEFEPSIDSAIAHLLGRDH